MSINEDDIAKTAALARLKIGADEAAEVTGRIQAILELVDQMQAIDTSSVEPMANPLDAVQILRPDEIVQAPDPVQERDHCQGIAPATEDGLYLVPKVIE